MSYDFTNETHRQILALEIISRLDTAGFKRETPRGATKELVFKIGRAHV